MSEEIKVRLGTKLTAEEAKKFDPSEIGVGLAATAGAEVEGQFDSVVVCPWCLTLRFIDESAYRVKCFRCGNCGGSYCV